MEILYGTSQDKAEILALRPAYKEYLQSEGYVFVAREDGRIVGLACGVHQRVQAPLPAYVWEDFILLLEVFREEDRHKGTALALVSACMDAARRNGSYQLRSYCGIENEAAHRLWLKSGFAISPVQMTDGTLLGSYVTYRIP